MNALTSPFERTLPAPLPWRPAFWPFRISARAGIVLRWIARVWGTVATLVFVASALQGGVPRSVNSENWEVPLQLALLGIVMFGGLLSWRWQALGASIITVGALSLGIFASISSQYSLTEAWLIGMIFYVPGLFLWLDWQRTAPVHAVITLAIAMSIITGGGTYLTDRMWTAYQGPSHPVSTLVAEPVTLVEWIWAGGMSERSMTIKAGIVRDSNSLYLLISQSPDMNDAARIGPLDTVEAGSHRILSVTAGGLLPGTRYYYAVEADGYLDLSRQGTFQTLDEGPFSFTFAVGGCSMSGSNGVVFETIRDLDPLFMIFNGDMFYDSYAANIPELFRNALSRELAMPAQAALYHSTPIVYVWDDHDYGPNNSDRESPSRDAVWQYFREMVPTHPLAVEGDAGPIYRAFTVGRVRFIVTDERSERSPNSDPDNAEKTMLGAEQKEWFKQQLLAAKDTYPVIVWVQGVPWISSPLKGSDSWAGFTTERREIADFIADNEITGLLMLAGDAHMLAIDDGTNSDYATDGGAAFPVFQAAALDRRGTVKGGPYSEGRYPGGGQFGLVTVEDDGGDTITITLSGRNWENKERVRYSYTVEAR
jgi:hypothetical protein